MSLDQSTSHAETQPTPHAGPVATAEEAMLRTVYHRVNRWAQDSCGSEADAADVTQQALLDVWQELGPFRCDGTFERQADCTAMRKARYALRIAGHRRGLLSKWLLPDSQPWGSGATQLPAETTMNVQSALSHLPAAQREALILHHGLGYSIKEVADLLATPVGTVKDRLAAGKKRLRRRLRDEVEFA